jgi:hypothetical protein
MLRKSPARTPKFLAANRRNAKKSTGPRTQEGKAVSALNALKHGGYALQLPEKLQATGHRGSAELYHRVRREIADTFATWRTLDSRQLDQLAAQVWLMARRAGLLGRKPESLILPSTSGRPGKPPFQVRMQSPGGRVALVYWVQRKKHGSKEKLIGSLTAGETLGEPPLRVETESKLRRRVVGLLTPMSRAKCDANREFDGRPASAQTSVTAVLAKSGGDEVGNSEGFGSAEVS